MLFYFDEAKPDESHSHYHIGAVGIDESAIKDVEERVADIARKAFGRDELVAETELHAAEIYHRKKNFKAWSDFQQRIDILHRCLRILSLEEVALIDIQINCDSLYGSTQDPAEIAFMFLCERANDLVRSRKSLGMLIGDRENDRISARYATTLSGYRAKGTGFQFGRQIEHLVDSVHFTHSHLSRLLQLADVYTWFLQFDVRNRGSDHHRHRAVFDLLGDDGVDLFPSKHKTWPSPPP